MSDVAGNPPRRWVRALGVVVAILTVVRVWLGPVEMVQPVYGQLPDRGAQRMQLVEESRRTNKLLAQILQTLEAGTLNVRVNDADKKSVLPVRHRGG